MRCVLRGASAADVDGLLALWSEAAENNGQPPDTRAAVTALLERDPDAVILAQHDGELIGSIIAGWDGWRCPILWRASGYRKQDNWRRWVERL